MDLITITTSKNLEDIKTAVDANTSKVTFPGFGTTGSTALAGDTTTISSAQSTAINANSLKTSFPGFGTTGGTALEGNAAFLQLGTTAGTALEGNTSLLQLGTSGTTAMAGNTATISSAQSTAILNNTAKVGITTTQANNITTNNAKVTSNWTINGASEIHRNSNVGIKNADPNVDLEIGDGTGNPVRIRLNGSNGQAISSEIIFTDNRGGANAEYYMGASIRFNSNNNRLEFLTDDGNDGTPEAVMLIHRAATPYIETTNILSNDLSVQTCNLKPLSVYCYGRRVNSLTDTDNDISLTTSGVDVVYRNILTNGIIYNTSTGVFTVPTTALYEITASVQIDCGAGAESIINIILKDAANNNLLKARGHVSRAESNNDTATQLNMIGMIRLVAGTSYNFVVASKNTGTGTIQNDIATANTLIIKGVVLQNSTSVPSNWGEAA
jgi:hypothetical protein